MIKLSSILIDQNQLENIVIRDYFWKKLIFYNLKEKFLYKCYLLFSNWYKYEVYSSIIMIRGINYINSFNLINCFFYVTNDINPFSTIKLKLFHLITLIFTYEQHNIITFFYFVELKPGLFVVINTTKISFMKSNYVSPLSLICK